MPPMRILISLLFIAILGIPCVARGQAKYYQADTSVKVFAYGKEQTLAWAGGFNNPQFSMADLNHDGLEDLIIFEPWNSLRTYINKGVPGNPDYRYAPEYEVNFPPILDYLVMADYNHDGVPDLFHQGNFGFTVYKGYYNEYTQLCFKYYKDLFYTTNLITRDSTNAFNNPNDIPAIVDVDGDGDLDFIAYDINGGNMNLYKNYQVELHQPSDSISLYLVDQCWGKVYQGFYREHTLAYACDNSRMVHPKTGDKRTHSGNTPCLFDWDMDGDYDYLDGSVSYNEMTFLKNGRKEFNPTGNDSMVLQDTMWQSFTGGKQIEMPIFPAAFNVDIDQDGKKDLLISPNGSQLSENYHCIWYYKNFSTPGVPDWRFQSDSFLTDKSIDLGTGSYPVLYDFDKDGKLDLLIGSDGYFQESDGSLRAKVTYYKNTSTTGHPSFDLQTRNFLSMDTFMFKGIAPAFGDIDNDNIADMVAGHADGTLSYFKNMAANDTALPAWQINQLALTDEDGVVINVGSHAAPFIYDMDHDGKKDLIIGNVLGTIIYYQNVSVTPGTLKLKLVSRQLGHIRADPSNTYGVYSAPFIGKIDSTGIEYLLLGSNSGNIYVYTGFQSGDTSATYALVSGTYSYIDSFYSLYNHPATAYGYYGGLKSTVAVGDIGGDGTLNMLVGNNKGGLYSYKAKVYSPQVRSYVGVSTVNEGGSVLLYPNPSKDMLTVSWSGILQPELQISFMNMEGQVLFSTTLATIANHAALSVAGLSSGMYVCLLQSGVNRYYSKFTVVH
jgi:hypothetical protein